MKTVVKMVSTFLYAGYAPRMPGTAGSAAGLLFALAVSYDKAVYLSSLSVLIILAMLTVKRAEILFGKRDSGRIVIDEAIGMMIALLFVPLQPAYVISAFVLFRIFDIFKPFPVNIAERAPSPVGVVLDDVIAGIYANIIVRAAIVVLLK
ncbi:MAG: phosphatidylglycerophosphatase A [Candidatus Omnitrophota bacterium]